MAEAAEKVKAKSAGAPEAKGPAETILTDKMMAAGMTEFWKEREFENDWEVVARIFGAMKAAEISG